MRIRAAFVEEPGGPFVVGDAELDEPRADEILVRITAVGICHTDLAMRATLPAQVMPVVLGHEGTGVVEAVGPDVTALAPGDTVALSYHSCGACPACAAGTTAYCTHFMAYNAGFVRPDGSTYLTRDGAPAFGGFFGQSSFATYALAYADNAVKIPAELAREVAAPLGCSVQTGVGAVFHALQVDKDGAFAVHGAGAVGLCAVLAAVARGCERIVVVEPVAARRELALDLGAHVAVDPAAVEDVAAAVVAASDGGVRWALDTTALPGVIRAAAASLGPLGTLGLVGIGEPEVSFNVFDLMTGGRSVRGIIEGDARPHAFLPELVALHAAGRLPLERLVTAFPFEEIDAAATAAATGAVVKPVLLL